MMSRSSAALLARLLLGGSGRLRRPLYPGRIVRLHGGRVDAALQEGKWAEFRFDLPQPLAAAGEGDAA